MYVYRIINDFGKPRSPRVATLRTGFLSIERVLPRAWRYKKLNPERKHSLMKEQNIFLLPNTKNHISQVDLSLMRIDMRAVERVSIECVLYIMQHTCTCKRHIGPCECWHILFSRRCTRLAPGPSSTKKAFLFIYSFIH